MVWAALAWVAGSPPPQPGRRSRREPVLAAGSPPRLDRRSRRKLVLAAESEGERFPTWCDAVEGLGEGLDHACIEAAAATESEAFERLRGCEVVGLVGGVLGRGCADVLESWRCLYPEQAVEFLT